MAGTGNPVPSDQIADLKANAETLDQFVSSDAESATTRTNKTIKTIKGIEQDANDAISKTGWFPVSGSFEDGGTITERNQVLLLQNADGSNGAGYYSWGGTLPKTVAAASKPSTTGGIGETAWVYRADAALRSELQGPVSSGNGALKVTGSSVYVGSITDLNAIPKADLDDGQKVIVKGRGEYYFDAGINDWVKDYSETPFYQYTQMGKAFDTKDINAPVNDNFAAWVHETVDYSSSEGKFIVFYNINPGHDISRNRVLLVKKTVYGEFETPTVVADKATTESCKCQAAGIAANGDYVALIGIFNWGDSTPIRTDIYRSSDAGATWSITTMKDSADNSNIVAYNGDVSGFLKLKSGRILTFAVEPAPSYLTRIYYSDDNGVTWNKSSIAGNPTDVTEPAWCELPDGTLVCMARSAVRTGSVTQVIPAKFMLSNDSGLTWTAPVDSQSITDFTLSNGKMILNEDKGYIEFIHHSRNTKPDNYSSLFVSRASFDEAKNDQFSEQVRIGKLAAYVSYEDSTGDSGYVGAAVSDKGVINAFYYNGKRNSAQINWAVGKEESAESREYFLNPFTGEPLTSDSGAGKYETLLFDGKLESYSIVSPMVETYTEGSSSVRKNEGSFSLGLSGIGRSSCGPINGINLTDVNTIFVSAISLSMDEGVDFGIAIFNKSNPTSPFDGRVGFFAERFNGNRVIEIDVSKLSGVNYPMCTLSNNSTAAAVGSVSVIQFGITSNIKKFGDLSDPGVLFSYYDRGNQLPFSSSGWTSAYSDGVGSATFNDDRITVVADGSTATSQQSVAMNKMLDLTGVSLVEVLLNGDITDPAASDFGVAVFNSLSPATPSTGRLAFKYSKEEGIYRAYLDVKSLTSGYIHIFLNANTSGSAPSVVTVDAFKVYRY